MTTASPKFSTDALLSRLRGIAAEPAKLSQAFATLADPKKSDFPQSDQIVDEFSRNFRSFRSGAGARPTFAQSESKERESNIYIYQLLSEDTLSPDGSILPPGGDRAQHPAKAANLRKFAGDDLPEVWRRGFSRLDRSVAPCTGFRSWTSVYSAARHFLDAHAETAAELGWGTLDLFGVHREVGAIRGDCCGALLGLTGRPIIDLTDTLIRFSDGLAYRRRPTPADLAIPVWEFGRVGKQLRGDQPC